jgi:hypothetical protein
MVQLVKGRVRQMGLAGAVAFAALGFAPDTAEAGRCLRGEPVADDMSCAATKSFANRAGYVCQRVIGGTDVLPLWGFQASPVCGIGQTAGLYWVRTADDRTCVIGYECRQNDSGH